MNLTDIRLPILPVPHSMDEASEDIYALMDGGYQCYACMAVSETGWRDIEHEPECFRSDATHGQMRAIVERRMKVGRS